MRNLNNELEKANLLNGEWDTYVFDSLRNFFTSAEKTNSIVCDFDSGEEICGFFDDTQLIAYVHLKFPIGFAKKKFEYYANKFKDNIRILTVDDFNTVEWFVDLEMLKVVASEISWHASVDAVNPNRFSVDDFRFATH